MCTERQTDRQDNPVIVLITVNLLMKYIFESRQICFLMDRNHGLLKLIDTS